MRDDQRTGEPEVSPDTNANSDHGNRETISFDSSIFNTKGSIFETIEFQPIQLDLNVGNDDGVSTK